MKHDFDAPVERAGSDSTKWAKYAGRDPDVMPLWVADMDFAAPPAVIEALHRRVEHGVFGYNQPTASQIDAVVGYLERHFGWRIDPGWIVWLPGWCRASTSPAARSAIPAMPYSRRRRSTRRSFPAPENFGRRAVSAPLVRDSAGWLWDFPAVDAVLRDQQGEALPAVPSAQPDRARVERGRVVAARATGGKARTGHVFGRNPQRTGALSPYHRHRLFATLSPELAARTITLMAPSKTYNIPGLGCAFAIIPDPTACGGTSATPCRASCRTSMPSAWRRPRPR
jgi:cystathionine beta-lyase